VLTTADTLRLAEGYVAAKALGPLRVKGLADPLQTYEVTGAGSARTRLQAAAGRGLTRFVGRDIELEQLLRAQRLAEHGRGQVVAIIGEAGVGKSRLVHEFLHSHTQRIGWFWNPIPPLTVAQRLTCRSLNCSDAISTLTSKTMRDRSEREYRTAFFRSTLRWKTRFRHCWISSMR